MKKLLTVKETADILSLSEYTIREWLKSGKISGIKIGRGWRIKEEDIESLTEYSPGPAPQEGAQK